MRICFQNFNCTFCHFERNKLQMFSIVAKRANLKGAYITGTRLRGDGAGGQLATSLDLRISNCDSYKTFGWSFCDDIIRFAFGQGATIAYLYLYFPKTVDEIILCEVEVFGGKLKLIWSHYPYLRQYFFSYLFNVYSNQLSI